MMAKLITRPTIFIVFLLIAASCKEISFKEPQPKTGKPLTAVPGKLVGQYTLANDDGKVEDTLIVLSNGYKMGEDPKDAAYLSDSLVLKSYKGYYFLNIKKDLEWYLRVIQSDKAGDLVYLAMEPINGDFSGYLERLSSEIQIDSAKVKDEKRYRIDPTPKQLVCLIEKGFFKKSVLKRIR